MTETPELTLPLLAPAQAQKHVTVNEALVRLDALAQLRLQSVTETVPPVSPVDGQCYGVPAGGVNAWAGQGGAVALASNGGWIFVPARMGWHATILDQGVQAIFDGADWRAGAATLTPGGAALAFKSTEIDVSITPGASVTTPILFPERAIAFGVTGRVIQALTGAVTAWDVGVAGELQRYGSGLGTALNSWVNGPGTPSVTWTPTALELTAQGGDFDTGTIRLIAHYAELSLPDVI